MTMNCFAALIQPADSGVAKALLRINHIIPALETFTTSSINKGAQP